MNFRELRRFVIPMWDREWLRQVGSATPRRVKDPRPLVFGVVGRPLLDLHESGDVEAVNLDRRFHQLLSEAEHQLQVQFVSFIL